MPRYVAFLRAINVGGASTVKMETLRRLFEQMGFSAVSTYIASGNVIFESPSRSATILENRIEEAIMQALGHELTPFVRTIPELVRIAACEPFPKTDIAPQDQLGVLFLSTPPSAEVTRALLALQTTSNEFRVEGREVYWLRHRGPGGELYATAPFDRALDQRFTIRSIGTVTKIAEKYGSRK